MQTVRAQRKFAVRAEVPTREGQVDVDELVKDLQTKVNRQRRRPVFFWQRLEAALPLVPGICLGPGWVKAGSRQQQAQLIVGRQLRSRHNSNWNQLSVRVSLPSIGQRA